MQIGEECLKYSNDADFPVENLPYGVFSESSNACPRIGIPVGKFVLDLQKILHNLDLSSEIIEALKEKNLNKFISLDYKCWLETRKALTKYFQIIKIQFLIDNHILFPVAHCRLHLPINIGDYTDFYCSKGHANNMGLLFRGKENDLPPNWLHLPVGYHGRASSVILSGAPITRPNGQIKPNDADPPCFEPSQKLDIELEMAFVVGGPENTLGKSISIAEAHKRIFGIVLMNDWSARDIQKWEYFPLGPFLGKSFATSISPWIVTIDALKPYSVPNVKQDPVPLPYLRDPDNFNFDIKLEILYKTPNMTEPQLISSPNFGKHLYWNLKQMLTHHSSNGCNLRPGDLIGTGTISGQVPDEFGSLVELSWNGKKPITMKETGETRTFLEDGDEITLRGYCEKEGLPRIGFGSCVGKILPAHDI